MFYCQYMTSLLVQSYSIFTKEATYIRIATFKLLIYYYPYYLTRLLLFGSLVALWYFNIPISRVIFIDEFLLKSIWQGYKQSNSNYKIDCFNQVILLKINFTII